MTGRTHRGSDLDLAVLCGRGEISFPEVADLTTDLASVFPGADVDLVFLDRADPLLLRRISESCRLLHGQARVFAEWKILAFKRYQDHRPFLDLERRWVERDLARRRGGRAA